MTRMKTIAAAIAAMSMAAVAAPAYSGEVEDLKASMKKMMQRIEQLEAQQKQQAAKAAPVAAPAAVPANVVTAGDLPNSIKVPGTNTSIRVYGYAQMDAVYDIKGSIAARSQSSGYDQNNYDWASFVAAQPLDKNQKGAYKSGQFYSTMKTSRLGLENQHAG